MIVLDYLKTLNKNEIVIPPFHTGHLGLLPNTTVRLGIMSPYLNEPSHCEIIVSPYESTKDLAILRCTMKDNVGIVKELIDALSYLKVNIITEESSSINHQSHHTINLLIDLSRSNLDHDSTYEWSKQKYFEYDYVFPVNDYKYLKIFETIVAFCGDSILWKEEGGKNKMQLYISPISRKDLHKEASTIIKKVSKNNEKNKVKIELSTEIIDEVRSILSPMGDDEFTPLKYILLSDTKERNLRIYFPKISSLSKIIHLGFYHNDRPGALSTILKIVADANFNIITGLLRKRSANISIWEGILEFKSDINFYEFNEQEELFNWVVNLIQETSNLDYNIKTYNISICQPLYPKQKVTLKKKPLNLGINSKNSLTETLDFQEKIKTLVSKLESAEDSKELEELISLANIIDIRNKQDYRKRVFLSFPGSAAKHAKIIRSNFGEDYYIDEYQIADGNIILQEVLDKIKACDYFVGVWHHEVQMPSKEGKFGISPWMPFELGIALSEKKKYLVVRSEELDERIWKRITPGKAIPIYNDLNFKDETIRIIRNFFKRHFR